MAWLFALAGLVPAGASVICALTGGLAGAFLLPELCQESRLVRCSMSRVTARTLTGERSVDLTRIRDVRLLTGFSYGGPFRAVVVSDGNGVRIGLTTLRSQRALVRALQHACGDARGGPRVSPAARAHLGLGVRRHRTIHTVIIFVLLTISISLYMGLVLVLAGFR
ncbi:hypothetical protein OH782_15120 [Streptomyces sp. NBC_01544]|uniref:hypothetical protein n=1 Tax=unclassified Streptomyces TaxID=2593676 RepID=UPI002ED52514|nr:hypothetical protein OHB17_26805 [Streptomyces sp. NBC_00724]